MVDTGNYEDLEDNVLNTKFQYPEGEVTDINEENVVITLPDGKETKIARRTAIQSLNDVAVWTEPKVKVGDKVTFTAPTLKDETVLESTWGEYKVESDVP